MVPFAGLPRNSAIRWSLSFDAHFVDYARIAPLTDTILTVPSAGMLRPDAIC